MAFLTCPVATLGIHPIHIAKKKLTNLIPLLQFFIFLFIAAEFGLYVLIRQLVNFKEWLVACESFRATWLLPVGCSSKTCRARAQRNAAKETARCSNLPSKSGTTILPIRIYNFYPVVFPF